MSLSVLILGMRIQDPSTSVQPESSDPDPRRDEELMALLQTGRDEPLGILMSRYGSDLTRYFLLRCNDAQAAQDLANETFYRIFAKARTFQLKQPFRPWFYAVATNVWRAWQRRRRAPELPLESLPETAEERSPSAPSPGSEKVTRLLGQLSEIDRDILVLRHYEGLKLKEIARRLELSPGAVYTRLFRALEKLRRPGPDVDSM